MNINRIFKLAYTFSKKDFFLSIIIYIFYILLNLVLALSIAPIVAKIISKDRYTGNATLNKVFDYFNFNNEISIFLIFFVSFFILAILTNILLNYLILKMRYNITRSIALETLNNFIHCDLNYLFKKNFGTIINTFSTELNKVSNSISVLILSFANILFVLCVIILIFYIDYKITLIMVTVFCIYLLLIFLLRKFHRRLGFLNTKTGNKKNNLLLEMLSQFKLIKSYNLENTKLNQYRKSFDDHCQTTIKFQIFSQSIGNLTQMFTIISIVSVFYILNENLSIINFAIIVLALQRIMGPITQIINGVVTLNVFNSALNQLENIIRETKYKRKKENNLKIPSIANSIEIKNLQFYYKKNKKIFQNLNFEFKKGKINIIKGASGKGKSTLIDLLLGFLKPTSGSIYIDKKNLNEINIENYRSYVGFVPQDMKLFNTTILKNVFIGAKNFNKKKLYKVLKLSGLNDIQNNFSKGLSSNVGESGQEISGGQKQRILLARALYKKSHVLILDEPTSNLDAKNREIIFKSLNILKNKLILIISTHNKIFLNKSDNILDLDLI